MKNIMTFTEVKLSKAAIVIGGTSGIGQGIAKRIKQGFEVTVVGRNRIVGEQMAKDFGVKFVPVDVSSLEELKTFALEWCNHNEKLDLIVHSADILRTKREDSVDGFELTFATKYLSRVSHDVLLAKNLWKMSEELTKVHFDFSVT
jgi:retinol dehydrogenase 12